MLSEFDLQDSVLFRVGYLNGTAMAIIRDEWRTKSRGLSVLRSASRWKD